MEVRRDNRHQPHTSLLWKLGCHGNQIEYINNLFVLSRIEFIFGIEVGINHIPSCSGNLATFLVAMVTLFSISAK